MKDRIIQLLTKENLSATKFADIIGVQRSSISHILSGRNKPSYDFIEKTLLKFPELNAEWLILGKGNTYKKEISPNFKEKEIQSDSPPSSIQKDLFNSKNQDVIDESINVKSTEKREFNYGVTNVNNKKIEKIVVFYIDKTFSEYYPE